MRSHNCEAEAPLLLRWSLVPGLDTCPSTKQLTSSGHHQRTSIGTLNKLNDFQISIFVLISLFSNSSVMSQCPCTLLCSSLICACSIHNGCHWYNYCQHPYYVFRCVCYCECRTRQDYNKPIILFSIES